MKKRVLDQKKLFTIIPVVAGDAIGVAVSDFDDLVAEVRVKFGDYRGEIKLYRDTGARVVDNNYFENLPNDIELYFAKDDEVFAPVKIVPKHTKRIFKENQSESPKESIVPILENKGDERIFKVLVVGEASTGKTSFIKRFAEGTFNKNYRATIGADFGFKVIRVNGIQIRLQLWDIAGQERFGHFIRAYYKGANSAMIVCDISSRKSFDKVEYWRDTIATTDGLEDIPVILLINKEDIRHTQLWGQYPERMTDEELGTLDQFCQKNKFLKYFYTSAKDGRGIDEATHYLVTQMLENPDDESIYKTTSSMVHLDDHVGHPKSRGCDC